MAGVYMRLLTEYPYSTKSITSGALMGLGDLISQVMKTTKLQDEWDKAAAVAQAKAKAATTPSSGAAAPRAAPRAAPAPPGARPSFRYDWRSGLRMTAFGTAFIGPVFHNWFRLLERTIPGTTWPAVTKKLAVDQLVMAPVFACVFWTYIGKTTGRSNADTQALVRVEALDTLKKNYMVWPAAQLLNFAYVPMQYRVLCLNCVGLGFNTYMAWREKNVALPPPPSGASAVATAASAGAGAAKAVPAAAPLTIAKSAVTKPPASSTGSA